MDSNNKKNRFLLRNPENGDFNQYWYSINTIETFTEEVREYGLPACGFISTPSLYFSLTNDERAECKLFDIDRKWENDPGFQYFDFNHCENIPEEIHHTLDMVVIDPPFITREVWEKYAEAANILLKPNGKIIATTIQENAEMLNELLNVTPQNFLPSVPNLVYQYNVYINYESSRLSELNPEIPI